MEEISNQDYYNIIDQWNKENNNFITIRSNHKIDDSTIKLNLKCGKNYITIYVNNNLDYFYVEPDSQNQSEKKDMEAAIVSINYFIFDSVTPEFDKILDVIKTHMTSNDSDMDLSSEEFDDDYNIGLTSDSQEKLLVKKNWELKDKELRKETTSVDFYNIPKNLLYTADIIFNIVSNELFKLNNQKNDNYQILIPNNNIYRKFFR